MLEHRFKETSIDSDVMVELGWLAWSCIQGGKVQITHMSGVV